MYLCVVYVKYGQKKVFTKQQERSCKEKKISHHLRKKVVLLFYFVLPHDPRLFLHFHSQSSWINLNWLHWLTFIHERNDEDETGKKVLLYINCNLMLPWLPSFPRGFGIWGIFLQKKNWKIKKYSEYSKYRYSSSNSSSWDLNTNHSHPFICLLRLWIKFSHIMESII